MKLGKRSLQALSTGCDELYTVAHAAIELGLIDFTVLECHREEERQNTLFDEGKSKVRFPNGKHNKLPSDAADIAPYVNGKISWDYRHCIFLSGVLVTVAAKMGINLRWGGNWDMDGEPMTDQGFQDLVHYEVIR